MAAEVEVRFVYGGEEKALKVPVEGKLDLQEIGKELFSLFPGSVGSSLGSSPSVQQVVEAAGPLLLGGCRSDFAPGTTGRVSRGGLRRRSVVVHINGRLRWAFLPDDIQAYSVTLEGSNSPFVLKIFYNTGIYEINVLEDISRLRAAQGIKCHSLPAMVEIRGDFITGHPAYGVEAHVLTPHAPPLPPSRSFSGRQLCNAAFDILLAIHHLRIVHRNVYTVERSDILFVDEQQVFLFANLCKAKLVSRSDDDDDVPAHGLLLPACLVLTLAALSGMQVVGLDELGYPNEAEVDRAVARLREEDDVLGDFAGAIAHLPPLDGKIDYEKWLLALSRVCDRSPAMIRKPGFLETAMKHIKLGCHQPGRNSMCKLLVLPMVVALVCFAGCYLSFIEHLRVY